MRDELMTREESIVALQPHLLALRRCIEDGWQDWIALLAQNTRTGAISRRGRANVVYDFIADRAEQYFDSVGVSTVRKSTFLVIPFAEGRLHLRFKKYRDESLTTSGIPTAQRHEIEHQSVTFDGMAVTYVVAGYVLDELEVELEIVALSCSFDGELLWDIDLRDETAAVIPVRSDDPVPPTVRSTRVEEQDDDQNQAEV